MSELLFESLWAGPLLWAVLYVSDYYLTIAGARLYQRQDKIVFEGSYEITPVFQADVNALRAFSPRFFGALVMSTGYLLFVRSVADPILGLPVVYVAVLGAMVLLQFTIHVRHLRNWFLYTNIGPVEGRVRYPRRIVLRASAFELLVFSGLYSALFFITKSTFLLGGACACGVVAVNHHTLARRHDAKIERADAAAAPVASDGQPAR